ncbi:MAG: TIGR01777 family oxidoreductase, partial [Ferruginibacter sp.]|nr:TIGR01777 family oxidoreductase [Ferruginibacter sp.]
MRNILITGGTGLVGKALVKQLIQKNYEVTILTRSMKDFKPVNNVSYALWNVKESTIDVEAVKKADAIIHLAGAGVMDKKWTAEYKKEIKESRTKSSDLIIKTLKNNVHKVQVIVSASAIGWYGEDKIPGHYFTENENHDAAFLGEVCKKWEASIEPAEALGIRVTKLRTGIVLSKDGGAYPEFKSSLKFGVASILGSGKQIVSWIHIDDLCRQYIFALENEHIHGSYNAVAPSPVSNKTLTLAIANKVKGKFYLPIHVPLFILNIMLGTRSIEILKSATVSA